MKIGFFASGRGSDMQALIDGKNDGVLDIDPVVLISNSSTCGARERAEKESIPFCHLSSKTHPDPDELDSAILDALTSHGVELVMLVGYMKKMGPKTLKHYKNRVLNIHPALLPAYGGEGMYGMHVHTAVVAAGEKETGVTIHIVEGEYDRGPILAQASVPVMPEDTAEELAARVLEREHSFLVETFKKIINAEILLPEKGQS